MKKIAFLGLGKLGKSLISAFRSTQPGASLDWTLIARNPTRARDLEEQLGLPVITGDELQKPDFDVVFFGVKPKDLENVLRSFPWKQFQSPPLCISLAAIIDLETLKSASGHPRWCRAMCNTSSESLKGMTLLTYPENLEPNHRLWLRSIFKSIGEIEEIPESLMDSGTVFAASAPAFVYQILSIIEETGIKLGFSSKQSRKIAHQVFTGALSKSEQKNYQDLISEVATPGGVTEAGLKPLRSQDFIKSLEAAFFEAKDKCKK